MQLSRPNSKQVWCSADRRAGARAPGAAVLRGWGLHGRGARTSMPLLVSAEQSHSDRLVRLVISAMLASACARSPAVSRRGRRSAARQRARAAAAATPPLSWHNRVRACCAGPGTRTTDGAKQPRPYIMSHLDPTLPYTPKATGRAWLVMRGLPRMLVVVLPMVSEARRSLERASTMRLRLRTLRQPAPRRSTRWRGAGPCVLELALRFVQALARSHGIRANHRSDDAHLGRRCRAQRPWMHVRQDTAGWHKSALKAP